MSVRTPEQEARHRDACNRVDRAAEDIQNVLDANIDYALQEVAYIYSDEGDWSLAPEAVSKLADVLAHNLAAAGFSRRAA